MSNKIAYKYDVTLETVTPKVAEEWLKLRSTDQRKLRTPYAVKLAQEMKAGLWRMCWDCITFFNGHLVNGQHRIAAVIACGVPIQALVLRTDDPMIDPNGDAGFKRGISDVLHIPNARNVAAAVRWILCHDKSLLTPFSAQTNKVPRAVVMDFIEYEKEPLVSLVEKAQALYRKKPIAPPSLMAAAWFCARRKHGDLADRFFESVYLGGEDDVTGDLHDRLVRNGIQRRGRMPQAYIFALTTKALALYLQGAKPGTLKISKGEGFTIIA